MTDRSRATGDDGSRTTDDRRSADASTDGLRRREFVALGAGASATLLAGCAGDGSLPSADGSEGSNGSDGSDGSQTLTGNFRLLISDAPADIDDFDRLDVTLDRARVFEAGDGDEDDEDAEDEEEADGDDEDDDADQNATATDEDDDSLNGTADEDDEVNETDVDDGGDDEEDVEAEDDDEEDEDDDEDDDEEDEDGGRGFTVVELGGATVDLTQVIDEDAIAVFDGEIPARSYEKIELEVSNVEGVVDGETVDVKLPSEKLQITNGFEVTPDEPVRFVFDINVVKRGRNNGYILKPVISGSGVAGRDVDVNEIDDDDDDEDGDDDNDEDEESEDDDSEADEDDSDDGDDDAETADDSEEDDATGGNETDDAENGTATGS